MNSTTHLLKCHPIESRDFVKGEGCRLFDSAGRSYLDLESGSWAAVLGHGHPAVSEALKRQLDQVMHLGVRAPNHLAEEAAETLLALLGWPEGKASFLSSGSEAVEFSVQVVRKIMRRPLLLGFKKSYLSAFGSAARKSSEEWHLIEDCPGGAADVEAVMETIPFERIGGFVLECGGGSPWFVRFPSARLVGALAEKVQADGGFVVANEVTTGFGRTGSWFGFEHYGLRPDLVALGKGLGNGYPVSAAVLAPRAAELLEKTDFRHAQSHQNNPLGCAAALAAMRSLREERWIERGARRGAELLERLRELSGRKTSVREVRGRGMLLALELKAGEPATGESLGAALFERGIIVGCYPSTYPAGTGVRLDPPLILASAECATLLSALDEALT